MRRFLNWTVFVGGILLLLRSGPSSGTPFQSSTASSNSQAAPAHKTYRDRREFAEKMAKVKEGDTKETVKSLLGEPEDIWRPPVIHPLSGDEQWCYGSDGHLSLPTLGIVVFKKGLVSWATGRLDHPPSPSVITEEKLRSGIRFIYSGPRAGERYDPLHLIRVVNFLQPLGKDKALAIIGEYTRVVDDAVEETWLFFLLRTLFDVPNPPRYMPIMSIGAMFPTPPEDLQTFPRYPIVIVDDISFSLLMGVAGGGLPEAPSSHVEYFRKNGKLRTTRLRPPDDPFLSLNHLHGTKEWTLLAKLPDTRNQVAELHRILQGIAFFQVLLLVRTAYDTPEINDTSSGLKPQHYERHHREFLKVGAYWDDKLQMYVKKDGSHKPFQALKN
jgi:hypothetical protein